MGVLTILLYASILLFPLGEVGRYIFPQLGTMSLLLNDVLVGVTVSVWVLIKIGGKEKIEGKLFLPIIFFLAACVVSLLVNSFVLTLPQVFISSLYLIRWGVYTGLYFVVRNLHAKEKQRVRMLLFTAGQITVLVGYIQFFIFPSLHSLYYLGWDEHLYRMFSVFLDPNFAGVFFMLIFFLSIGFGLTFYEKKQYVITVIFTVFALLDGIALYLTYSRSGLLAFIVGVIVFFWLYGKKKFIAFSIIFIILAIFFSPKSFQTEGTNILRIASTEARLDSSKWAVDIIVKNPVFGVGFNSYRYAQNRYGFLKGKYWEVSHAGAGTDNSYLFVFATTGIVGFSLYLFLLIQICRLYLGKSKPTFFDIVTLASFLGVCVSSLFINSLFYIFIMEWLWILIATTSEN